MNDLRVALLLTAALALGGCDVTTSANASRGGANVPQSSNTAFNSLIGSKIGASLDDQDRELAYDAQIDATENGAPGAPVPWRNPQSGRHGNIVAGPAYDIRAPPVAATPIPLPLAAISGPRGERPAASLTETGLRRADPGIVALRLADRAGFLKPVSAQRLLNGISVICVGWTFISGRARSRWRRLRQNG